MSHDSCILCQLWIHLFESLLILPNELQHRGNGVLSSLDFDLVLASQALILAHTQPHKILMHLFLQEGFEVLELHIFKYLLVKERLSRVPCHLVTLSAGCLCLLGMTWPHRRERIGFLYLELSIQIEIVVQYSPLLFLLWF